MNESTKALAEKTARGKGLNAEDRELMLKVITAGGKEYSEFSAHIIATGKTAALTTIELAQGTGNYKGLYFKIQVPGARKVGGTIAKFKSLKRVLNILDFEVLEKAHSAGVAVTWAIGKDDKVSIVPQLVQDTE